MVARHILTHSLFFGLTANLYLLIVMMAMSPRIWGYADYPDHIKNKVPPQTKREKTLAAIVGIPWMIYILGFPIYSTYILKASLGNEIPFWTAFFNILAMSLLASLIDLVVLDWLILSKLTPNFVIIPGSEREDYADFSHHYRAQGRATGIIVVVCLILAGIVWYF